MVVSFLVVCSPNADRERASEALTVLEPENSSCQLSQQEVAWKEYRLSRSPVHPPPFLRQSSRGCGLPPMPLLWVATLWAWATGACHCHQLEKEVVAALVAVEVALVATKVRCDPPSSFPWFLSALPQKRKLEIWIHR